MPGDIQDPQPGETSALLKDNNSPTVASYVDDITERERHVDNVDDTPIPEELPSVQLILVLLAVWVANNIHPTIEYSVH